MYEMKIEMAAEKDFDQIFALLQQLWPDKELNKRLLFTVYNAGFKSKNPLYVVVRLAEKIVGFGSLRIKSSLWLAGNLAYIDELVVDADYRGKGIGTKLLNKLTEIARDNECKRIELDSAYHRKEAHRFYEAKGFINRAALFSKVLI